MAGRGQVSWSGNLPSGKSTTSQRRYVKEWRAFAAPLEKALGMMLGGFDPGILLHSPGYRGPSVQLDGWVVKKLNVAVGGKPPAKKAAKAKRKGER